MPILQCYVDDRTLDALKRASEELGRPVEELAEAAISEAALHFAPWPTEQAKLPA